MSPVQSILSELDEILASVELAPEVDDNAEFNAEFESLRIASGPHLPISLARYVCGNCGRVNHDEIGNCLECGAIG